MGVAATALQQEAEWPPADFDPARAAEAIEQLEEILARPEYQWAEEQSTLLERLWERLQRFLISILPEESGNLATILPYVVTPVGALLLLLVILYAIRNLISGFTADTVSAEEEAESLELSAGSAARRAAELSRDGDYRNAVRYLYLSALLSLDERGLLRYDRYKTNREYLRSVADRPELAGTLRHVVDVFDAVWYGFQPLDADSYNRYEAQVALLRRQA